MKQQKSRLFLDTKIFTPLKCINNGAVTEKKRRYIDGRQVNFSKI